MPPLSVASAPLQGRRFPPAIFRSAAHLGGRRGHGGTEKRRAKERSPLESFLLDPREVQHMSPHVLSAAVASAGSNRQRSEPLWKAYSERALAVKPRLTMRDVRLIVKGYADASVRDGAALSGLLGDAPPWDGACGLAGAARRYEEEAAPRDLLAVAVALSRLRFRDRGVFESLGARLIGRLEAFTPMEVASLANAFSRAGCGDQALLPALAARFGALVGSGDIAPAVAALALNAFAVSAAGDAELWRCALANAVAPRAAEYTVTQAALVADAAARRGQSLALDAASAIDAFAAHWAASGDLARSATAEDLAYIAGALAQLRATADAELNAALAGAALQRLSAFRGGELAALLAGLARLPSPARGALFAAAARHALGGVAPECSLGHLGQLVSAYSALRVPVPEDVGRRLAACIVARAQEARRGAEAAEAPGGQRSSPSAPRALGASALGGLLDGALNVLPFSQGPALLEALRPLVLDLLGQGALPRGVARSVFRACAYFQVRDRELLEQVAGNVSARGEQMLVSAGMLGLPLEGVISCVNASPSGFEERLSLQDLSQALLAAASLGLPRFAEAWLLPMLRRAAALVGDGAPPREAARLAVALAALRLQTPALAAHEDALALEAALRRSGPPVRLEPPPPQGLQRTAAAALERLFPGACAPGVAAMEPDLLLRRSGGDVAVELDGPNRFYHGQRELSALCGLKGELLQDAVGAVVRIGHWEWPTEPEQQDAFLRARLGAGA